MKQKPPDIVVQYRNAQKLPMPKCCHTCEHFTDTGMCNVFHMEPPQDFAEALDQCPSYLEEIPW